MPINPRRKKCFKRKVIVYALILLILGASVFFLNIFNASRKPLFISPVGKVNTDVSRVEKILKDNKILFSSVTLSDNYYSIDIQDNGQVKLSQNDVALQIDSLQRILIQLTIEGKSFKMIDFRFAEPIISF